MKSKLSPVDFAAACMVLALKFKNAYLAEEAANRKSKVNFNCTDVHTDKLQYGQDTVCTTVACHGGWAAVFFLPHVPRKSLSYTQGANALAKHLGFDHDEDLEIWAHKNPKLWGNHRGSAMFSPSGHEAFGFKQPFECTLIHIASHWASVGERVLDQYLKSVEKKSPRKVAIVPN